MLFNPNWNKTKVQPSLEGFINWLRKQPPDASYEHRFCSICAIGQYLQSIGTTYLDEACGANHDLIYRWEGNIVISEPHTFGAALKRAEAFNQCSV